MESQRNLLLIGLLFVSFLIYQQWQVDQNPPPVQEIAATVENNKQTSELDSQSDVPATSQEEAVIAVVKNTAKEITVKTDVLDVTINSDGGDITYTALRKYNNTLDSVDPFVLLKQTPDFTYIMQSGLIGRDGPDASPEGRPVYHSDSDNFELADNEDKLSIPLTFTNEQGLKVIKTYTFTRNSYKAEIEYKVQNNTQNDINVRLYGQLKETISDNGSNLMMPVYRGGAFSTDDIRYEKYKYTKMEEEDLDKTTTGGWVAMLQHYFVAAWLPNPEEPVNLYSKVYQGKDAIIGFKTVNTLTVAPGQSNNLSAQFWIGPKLQEEMTAAYKNLELTSDYGWLWFISLPLFQLLTWFHSFLGNWGLAIIFITFTVKGAMFPLTRAQYTSMAKMRLLQPKMAALKERFGDDKQKMSQAMMEMYKKEKVNPLGGCFPILLQMPIFIALYYALMESVGLRQAPFIFWINDLSVMDPYYILPALMGVSMFFIQKMSPTTVTDPMQQKVMQFMPIIFTVFFIWFPSGLVLYWLVSNIVTLIQQTIIFRSLEKKGLHSKKSKK